MLAMVVRAHFRSYQPGDSSYNNALYVYRNRDWKHMMLRTKKKEKKIVQISGNINVPHVIKCIMQRKRCGYTKHLLRFSLSSEVYM